MNKIKTQMCPNCLTYLDGCEASDGSDTPPGDGDATICLACATILLFENGKLRLVTLDDYKTMDHRLMGDLFTARRVLLGMKDKINTALKEDTEPSRN